MRLGVEAALVRGQLVPGDVGVRDGLIDAVGLSGRGSGVAVPGFVDMQVNGYGGIDLLTEPERWMEVDEMLAAVGITTWQPTLISAEPEQTLRALRAIDLRDHLEGPFLGLTGAHPRDCLREPDLELLRTRARWRARADRRAAPARSHGLAGPLRRRCADCPRGV